MAVTFTEVGSNHHLRGKGPERRKCTELAAVHGMPVVQAEVGWGFDWTGCPSAGMRDSLWGGQPEPGREKVIR